MASRISLLLLSPTLSDGGAERFASIFLRHLDRERFAPGLCLLHGRVSYPVPADVPLHVLHHPGLYGAARSVRRLRRVLAATRPQVVLSTIAYASVFTAFALRGAAFRPAWVARVGNDPTRTSGLRGRWMRRVLRRAYLGADGIIANSEGLAHALREEIPAAAGRIAALRNPVELPGSCTPGPSPASSEPSVVLALGRLVAQKRPDLLLEAFARVARERRVELWFCGEGPLRGPLEARVRSLGLADRVRLLGFRPDPEPLLRRASLFALASDHEGLPNALIEAQAAGLAAVATRCRYGPGEIIEDGSTGLLVEPGDVEGFAGALRTLLDDPARARRMGQEGARRVRARFDASQVVREWEKLLVDAAEAGTRGGP